MLHADGCTLEERDVEEESFPAPQTSHQLTQQQQNQLTHELDSTPSVFPKC